MSIVRCPLRGVNACLSLHVHRGGGCIQRSERHHMPEAVPGRWPHPGLPSITLRPCTRSWQPFILSTPCLHPSERESVHSV